MARNPRLDEPGAWHHVMNRGIAKRTLFEGTADIRYFLSRLARAVRAGALEVHAFCVMTTHFHLLVRSVHGGLSEAMRQIQLDYVRKFNRSRRRDGPLVRGRFHSKPVRSLVYRRILVRYIDLNPVRAGICLRAEDYPFGSASLYRRDTGPPWLERSWVEEEVRGATGSDRYIPGDYICAFDRRSDTEASLVERRILATPAPDSLDELVSAPPPAVLSWMRWKARLADGTEPGLPVADGACVDAVVREARDRGTAILLREGRADLRVEIHAGLLRDLSGAALVEIAGRIGRGVSCAGQLCRRYAERLAANESYAQHAGRLARAALDVQYGTASLSPREDVNASCKK